MKMLLLLINIRFSIVDPFTYGNMHVKYVFSSSLGNSIIAHIKIIQFFLVTHENESIYWVVCQDLISLIFYNRKSYKNMATLHNYFSSEQMNAITLNILMAWHFCCCLYCCLFIIIIIIMCHITTFSIRNVYETHTHPHTLRRRW